MSDLLEKSKHDCAFYIGSASCLACCQDDAEEFGFKAGAAVAFGLVGMAEAIRTRPFDPFASYNADLDRGSMVRVQKSGVGQAVVIAAGRNRREEVAARPTGDADASTSLLLRTSTADDRGADQEPK